MFPTLLQIGPVTISTIGVMTALGFFLGSFLVWQKGREEHFEEVLLMDGVLLVCIAGLIGARVWYTVSNWGKVFLFDLVNNPGFSWNGALLTGILALIFYCKSKKWDFYKVADLSVFGLVLSLILVKIGLFLNSFSLDKFFQQIFLYEIILLILVYRLLLLFDKNYRIYEWYKNKRGEVNSGFLFLCFLILSTLIFLGTNIFSNWPKVINFHLIIDLLIILISLFVFYFRSGDHSLTIPWLSFKKKEWVKQSLRLKTGMEAKKLK